MEKPFLFCLRNGDAFWKSEFLVIEGIEDSIASWLQILRGMVRTRGAVDCHFKGEAIYFTSLV